MSRVTLTVNGAAGDRGGGAAHPSRGLPARGQAADRHASRLRTRRLRRVHAADRWRAGTLLHRLCRCLRGRGRAHDRGTGGRSGDRPVARRIHGGACFAVRLLHTRHAGDRARHRASPAAMRTRRRFAWSWRAISAAARAMPGLCAPSCRVLAEGVPFGASSRASPLPALPPVAPAHLPAIHVDTAAGHGSRADACASPCRCRRCGPQSTIRRWLPPACRARGWFPSRANRLTRRGAAALGPIETLFTGEGTWRSTKPISRAEISGEGRDTRTGSGSARALC